MTFEWKPGSGKQRVPCDMLRCLQPDLNLCGASMDQDDGNGSLLSFPCDFPIKVMGHTADDFDALVVGLVRKHSPDLLEGAVRTRLSRQGKFISITVTVQAQSRAQLDAIYMELTAHERVLMAF